MLPICTENRLRSDIENRPHFLSAVSCHALHQKAVLLHGAEEVDHHSHYVFIGIVSELGKEVLQSVVLEFF